MSKRKKTLKEKKLSDMRKSSTVSSSPSTGSNLSATFSFTSYQMPASHVTGHNTTKSENIAHGLEKTLIVSSIIVILQLAFFFLLTHHMLVLPFKIIQY